MLNIHIENLLPRTLLLLGFEYNTRTSKQNGAFHIQGLGAEPDGVRSDSLCIIRRRRKLRSSDSRRLTRLTLLPP